MLVGGIGTIGGYFAASALSALLQPLFGWRIMWFLNLPIGLILIALSPLIPESARFLQQMGRLDAAHATLARFGAVIRPDPEGLQTEATVSSEGIVLVRPHALLGTGVAEGRSVGLASTVIAQSALIAAPTIVVAAYLYSVWSTKRSLILAIGITTLGLIAVLLRGSGALPMLSNPLVPLSLLIIGSSGVISIHAATRQRIIRSGCAAERPAGSLAGVTSVG